MFEKKPERDKQKKVKHSYGCPYDSPDCVLALLGRICEILGHDIPSMLFSEFVQRVGIQDPAAFRQYLQEHFVLHDLLRVLRGEETVHPDAITLAWQQDDGFVSRYCLVSPRDQKCSLSASDIQ